MALTSLTLSTPISTSDASTIQIVDTMEITPNPVILLDIHKTEHWEEHCIDNALQISQEDAQRLMRIAYAEGGNQGVQGQLMIMQTIINRVKDSAFPDTIKEVILQDGQFSSVSDGRYFDVTPNTDSHLALAELEKNISQDENLIGFETNSNGKTLLKYFDYYTVHKDHTFYQKKKRP